MNRLVRIIQSPIFNILPDKVYLKLHYHLCVGKPLNIKNPKNFSEKLQWLKLNDRKKAYIKMVDKYEAKKYVAEQIGQEYIVPTLGVWNNVEDIEWDKLPKKFVLKCTHDSGGLVICKDKNKLDINMAKDRLNRSLNQDYYLRGREWPYKYVDKRIIAEEYLNVTEDDELNSSDLADYKFFCFSGKPYFCQVILDRSVEETIDFFDMEWKKCEFSGLVEKNEIIEHSKKDIPIPQNFNKMKCFSAILAKNISFARIDFYEVNGHLYFGEITLYPASGFGEFRPNEWNEKIGNLIKL